METLLVISIALLAGLFMSRVAKAVNLPAVTAYLIAGILIGPFCLGRLQIPGLGFNSLEQVRSMGILSDAAMGFIAFAIGNEFRLSDLKKNGVQATVVGTFQALVAALLVDAVLIGLHFLMPDRMSLSAAITLGAIAAATAPAATLMVVRQYKAKGPLTDILLPIVALDDAVGLVIFAVSFGVAQALQNGQIDVVSVVAEPLLEVVLSLALGFVMGLLFSFTERLFQSSTNRLEISITYVLMVAAITMLEFDVGGVHISFSSLLTCMMLGTVFCNVCDVSEDLMERTENWTDPLSILFFVLSGAELDFSVILDVAIIGIGLVYIVSRSAGKYFGAKFSAKATKCAPTIVKYLGITLLPQAGVALGMSIMAESLGPEGMIIRNIVLFGVLVYELIGPTLTKIALTKAGEIVPEAK